MSVLWVWVRYGGYRLARRLKEADGLTIIEYVVFAAFVVVGLSAVAILLGPQLKDWMGESLCTIMGKKWTPGAAGSDIPGTCTK